jgi:hypothetical protein
MHPSPSSRQAAVPKQADKGKNEVSVLTSGRKSDDIKIDVCVVEVEEK